MEQFFRGGTKFSEKNVPGTKIFTENFVPPNKFPRNKIPVTCSALAEGHLNSVYSLLKKYGPQGVVTKHSLEEFIYRVVLKN